MADKVLSAEDQQWLTEQFIKVESGYEKGKLKDFVSKIEDIDKLYKQ